jgi:uncharacterized protein (DUF1697 family)
MAELWAAVSSLGFDDVSTSVIGRTLYLHTPDGFGTSELAKSVTRVTTAAGGTARNLATTAKLLSPCDGAE